MAAANVYMRYRDRPANYSEDDDEECEDMFDFVTLLAITYLSKLSTRKKKTKRKKRFWIQPSLKQRPMKTQQTTTNDAPNLESSGTNFSSEKFHMSTETFLEIAAKIKPFMISRKSKRPDRITDLHRLAITLDFLANSIQQKHLAQNHHISKQVLGVILDEVCLAIINGLKQEVTPVMNEENWLQVARDFNEVWNFPHCLGAINGKYVDIEYPRNYQTVFKSASRILVTGVADSHYRFIHFDVTTCDIQENGVDFPSTSFGKRLFSTDNVLGLPGNQQYGGKYNLPFVYIADDAYPLSTHVIKPFHSGDRELSKEETIFNRRLHHAKLSVDNAFGILASKWRCLSKRLVLKPDRAKLIVKACCVLHNYLMTQNTYLDYCPLQFADYNDQGNLINGKWRSDSSSNAMLNSQVGFDTLMDPQDDSAIETRQILMESFSR
uniref:DDE Tnp4 domain-containing protein n=1 Tax=Strigamia maritima TaxID=126957 RepID=T1IHT3_STRMM